MIDLHRTISIAWLCGMVVWLFAGPWVWGFYPDRTTERENSNVYMANAVRNRILAWVGVGLLSVWGLPLAILMIGLRQ